MNTKEQWIQKTMGSMDEIHPAKCTPRLLEQIKENPFKANDPNFPFKPSLVLQIAAGLILLISMNVFSIIFYTRSTDNTNAGNPLAKEYFSYIKTLSPEP